MLSNSAHYDLVIVGGGINGTGIARDAAGRGLKVLLCEQHDLAQHTSSASSKLIHGGLRYLEQFEFRLVREALAEREVLLRTAPHIVHPMRFVMPHVPALRPAWMIRVGLFLYDYLARRDTLADSQAINLRDAPFRDGLKPGLHKGFLYSDCQVDDARLVLANARAAADLGATILTRTLCCAAAREGGGWRVALRQTQGGECTITCRALIDAAGPWAADFMNRIKCQESMAHLRLVKGSHIVVPRLYAGDHAFILQNDDRRVIFVCPYEEHFNLVGTTDIVHDGAPSDCVASAEEIVYLCRAVNRYFTNEITTADVVWHYSGLRPLVDDGTQDASRITRDYTLRVHGDVARAPLLCVFGGKITTYRKLAEHALEKLHSWFPAMRAAWTADTALSGGDLGGVTPLQFADGLAARYPALPRALLLALVKRHGAFATQVLGDASTPADLGRHFGHTLYAREVDYFLRHEWAHTAEDVMWRRTKCGLNMNLQQKQELVDYVTMTAPRFEG